RAQDPGGFFDIAAGSDLVPEFDRELRGFSRWLIATSHCYFPQFEGCCNEPLNPRPEFIHSSAGKCACTARRGLRQACACPRPVCAPGLRAQTRACGGPVSIMSPGWNTNRGVTERAEARLTACPTQLRPNRASVCSSSRTRLLPPVLTRSTSTVSTAITSREWRRMPPRRWPL